MVALVARVVATTNQPSTDLLASLRPTVTLYRIHVRQFGTRQFSWCVLRRYSEFVDLHAAVGKTVPSLPTLPPKLVLNTADALADRYLDLDAFLRSLLAMPAAAAHPRLRSFLGADGVSAPPNTSSGGDGGGGSSSSSTGAIAPCDDDDQSGAPFSSSSPRPSRSTLLEDDWEHEPSTLSPANSYSIGYSAADHQQQQRMRQPAWLLSGSWVADESRSRDSLEPMLKAMGTPWAARRMVRGLRIISTLAHEPGVRLVEVASSSLGEGKPSTFELDGETRSLWMGRKEGSVRAVELRRTGAVRLEITLPDGKGMVMDTRRVLPSGSELERIIELRLVRQPPLRLHRLLVRTDDEQQPLPRSVPPVGPTSPPVSAPTRAAGEGSAARGGNGAGAQTESSALDAAAADVSGGGASGRRGGRRLARRPERVYRHERAGMLLRLVLDGVWRLLAWVAKAAVAAPGSLALMCMLLAAHALCFGVAARAEARGYLTLPPELRKCEELAFALVAPSPSMTVAAAAAAEGALRQPREVEVPEEVPLALHHHQQHQQPMHAPPILLEIPARTLLLGVDALVAAAALRALLFSRN